MNKWVHRGYEAYLVLRERTLTFKLSYLKMLSKYGSILLGATRVVGGWPSPEGL